MGRRRATEIRVGIGKPSRSGGNWVFIIRYPDELGGGVSRITSQLSSTEYTREEAQAIANKKCEEMKKAYMPDDLEPNPSFVDVYDASWINVID